MDFIFLVDMVLIFNTAFYDEDFKMIQHRGVIAVAYLKDWFLVSLVVFFPSDLLQQQVLAQLGDAVVPVVGDGGPAHGGELLHHGERDLEEVPAKS